MQNRSFKINLKLIIAVLLTGLLSSSNCYSKDIKAISSKDELAKVYKQQGQNVIYFFSNGCPACRKMAPNFDSVVASQKDGNYFKVEIDKPAFKDILKSYGIQALPTLIFIKNGTVANKRIGSLPKAELTKVINDFLSGKKAASINETKTKSSKSKEPAKSQAKQEEKAPAKPTNPTK